MMNFAAQRGFIFFTALLLYLASASSEAYAADFTHGDACTAAGAWHATNDAGGVDFLVCNGSNWITAYSIPVAGNVLRLDNDPAVGNAGCFRYNGTAGRVEFANDCSNYSEFAQPLWSTGAGNDIYYTSGTPQVGIGTPSPSYSLDVNGVIRATDHIVVDPTAGAATPNFFDLGDLAGVTLSSPSNGEVLLYSAGNWMNGTGGGSSLWTAGAGDIIYYSTGTAPQVGIGTNTPSAQSMLDVHGGGIFARHGTNPIFIEMDVIGNIDDSVRVKVENNFTGGNEPDAVIELDTTGNGEASVEFEVDDSRIWQIITGDNTNNRLRIEDGNDSPVITFESGGRVGIGDTTPDTVLDVTGSSVNGTPIVEITQNTLNGEILEARNANGTVVYNFWLDDEGDPFLDFNNDAGDMQLQLRMSSDIILDLENTGATPGDNDAILRLNSNTDGEQQIEFNYNGTNNWTILGDDAAGGDLRIESATGTHLFKFVSASGGNTGYFGINETAPSVALDVVGDINYTGVIVDVSDIRMKYDIAPLESPLSKLTSLNGFSFKMKDGDRAITEYGVSAQDVQKVFPELVHKVDDNGTLGVSYDGLIAPMIEAMKAQQAQIEALQAEVNSLKSQIGEAETTSAEEL